jgi:hypothetical protein
MRKDQLKSYMDVEIKLRKDLEFIVFERLLWSMADQTDDILIELSQQTI